ncbi:sulfur carrier protein ThiS [Kineococcus sp. SYSU DK006]|uniref:sulfur carrier protein ThiS n=1 Tax=Kineococcus sp. SYSU DK006 TaxID=3383127 RepID=UPI003D7E3FAE
MNGRTAGGNFAGGNSAGGEAEHAQVQVVVNGAPLHVPAGSTVADVVALFAPGVRDGRGAAVAVGDDVLPAGSWAGTPVTAGDRLEVLQAVAGG